MSHCHTTGGKSLCGESSKADKLYKTNGSERQGKQRETLNHDITEHPDALSAVHSLGYYSKAQGTKSFLKTPALFQRPGRWGDNTDDPTENTKVRDICLVMRKYSE